MMTQPKTSFRPPKPLAPELMQALKQAYSLHSHGRIREAQQLYLQILQHRPDSPEANFLLGNLIFQLGDLAQAEGFLRKAVRFAPNDVRHLNALGVLLLRTGQYAEAAQMLDKATRLEPRNFEAWSNLGAANIKLDRFEAAEKALLRALTLRTNDSRALNNLGNAYLGLCQIGDSIKAYQAAFAIDHKLLSAVSNSLMNSHYLTDMSPEQVFAAHQQAASLFPQSDWQPEPRTATSAKVRIGFVSADFRTHSVAYFLLPLLEHLDRERFELFGFYNDGRVDAMTERFIELFDHWHVVNALTDTELLSLLRTSALDVVVDLAGHTGNNRLAVLNQRVAPKQVSWLGYPHSTGLPAMDYRVVDTITDPMPQADRFATEKLLHLPGGFLCYRGDESVPVRATPPCFETGYITFGSFNNLAKVNDAVLECWIDILKHVPDSRLLLKAKQLSETKVQARLRQRFEQAGIAAERLELMSRTPDTTSHLDLYARVDIALDTFPYNGTTTTCEALWMGVPVIAFAGDRHAARVSVSILEHAGFSAFVGLDENDYKRLARDWARKPEALKQLRQEMRARLQASALGDGARMGREMGALLASI